MIRNLLLIVHTPNHPKEKAKRRRIKATNTSERRGRKENTTTMTTIQATSVMGFRSQAVVVVTKPRRAKRRKEKERATRHLTTNRSWIVFNSSKGKINQPRVPFPNHRRLLQAQRKERLSMMWCQLFHPSTLRTTQVIFRQQISEPSFQTEGHFGVQLGTICSY